MEYYNFILLLYVGFMFIYVMHPEPKVFYKKTELSQCKIISDNNDSNKVCVEE